MKVAAAPPGSGHSTTSTQLAAGSAGGGDGGTAAQACSSARVTAHAGHTHVDQPGKPPSVTPCGFRALPGIAPETRYAMHFRRAWRHESTTECVPDAIRDSARKPHGVTCGAFRRPCALISMSKHDWHCHLRASTVVRRPLSQNWQRPGSPIFLRLAKQLVPPLATAAFDAQWRRQRPRSHRGRVAVGRRSCRGLTG